MYVCVNGLLFMLSSVSHSSLTLMKCVLCVGLCDSG